jgi:putative tricarboxylic transport membrane protein
MLNRAEAALTGALFVLAIVFTLFMDQLIAKPKMLFGRALTAMEPSLFPLITMVMMGVLCTLYLWVIYKNRGDGKYRTLMNVREIVLLAAFFAILVLYALTFKPFGFLISTFIAMALISLLVGNRSVWQVLALSFVSPVAIYIVSTRLLKVSLPELSSIEFAYAAILGS